jgi:hypothetical protein
MNPNIARRKRIRKQRRADAWDTVKDFAGFACIVLIAVTFIKVLIAVAFMDIGGIL